MKALTATRTAAAKALPLVLAVSLLAAAPAGAAGGGTQPGSTKPPVTKKSKKKPAKKKRPKVTFPISKPTTLGGFLTTEYWPVPERWFVGKRVKAPGLAKRHRVDFLYSARGVAMEGDGLDLQNKPVHWVTGSGNWVGSNGRPGSYYWLGEMFWRNRSGNVTFPLERGGWSNGSCKAFKSRGSKCRYVGPRGTRFATGPSTGASGVKLRPLRSVAVDPRVIRYRSGVYIPAYAKGGYDGWFCAADTGGAIKGRHLDVFRRAPSSPSGGSSRRGQTIRVWPPDVTRRLYPSLCSF
jgi:3D (Asp-Asp-Asp) domain-containing protein